MSAIKVCKCGAGMEHLLIENEEEECILWCPGCGRALRLLRDGTEWFEPSTCRAKDGSAATGDDVDELG